MSQERTLSGRRTSPRMARSELDIARESEARYRGLLEAAPDAMVVVNGAGEIVLLNAQAEKQFGYNRDELLGQQVTNIIPEGFAERLIADDFELVARRRDGSEFPIEIMLSPLEGPEGILVTAAIRDISVRKAAEEELRESEDRFRYFFDHAVLAKSMTQPSGEMDVNEAFLEMVGYTREEMAAGKTWHQISHPDDTAKTNEIVASILSGACASARFEKRYLHKNGSVIWTDVSTSLRRDADGHPSYFMTSVVDITERKAAEEHLAQMEARYRGLLEAAPDAMVVVNGAGEIVLLNAQAEKQFGYNRDELLGQQVTNIIPEGFAERLIADDFELVARRRDGSEFPIEIMLSPLEGPEGILVTAAIRDISVRKAAEEELRRKAEELRRSNDELGQFAYIASHDLQEPLRMVTSYTQLLAKRYKGRLDSDADEFIGFAVDGAGRMQRLIEDLLTYSRVETRGADLLDVSSEEALQLALINLSVSIDECGAVVTHDPLPRVLADETQLVQLFQNLVGNAIKYRRPGVPRVQISAIKDRNDCWSFAVTDNGLGIEPQYFDRIFGMFQRLNKREEYDGTGIGLAVCKKIVERHGGSISVESRPGQGSTFRFALPGSDMKS